MDELIEVRLLGPGTVRAAAGEMVRPEAWRTVKNRDLFRLLALRPREIIPIEQVVDSLWPDVEPTKARTSLRTAIAQVRRATGAEAIERVGDGLRIGPAWIDLDVYRTAVAAAHQHLSDGHIVEGIIATRDAVTLRREPLLSDDPYSDWLANERTRIEQMHSSLLVGAATSALAADLVQDALDLAGTALHHDPASERAARVAMVGFARLGDTALALRTHRDLAEALDHELGAVPTAETDALRDQILAGAPITLPLAPSRATGRKVFALHGRAHDLERLCVSVEKAVSASEARLVLLTGPSGSGISRLLAASCTRWQRTWGVRTLASIPSADELTALGEPIIVIDGIGVPGDRQLTELLEQLGPTGSVVVLGCRKAPARPSHTAAPTPSGSAASHPVTVIRIGGLDERALTDVIRDHLGAHPTPALIEQLHRRHSGLPGPVLDDLRAMRQGGQLVATARGLDATSSLPRGDHIITLLESVAHARSVIGGEEQDLIDLLAVGRAPVTAATLARLSDGSPPVEEVERMIARLESLGVVTTSEGHHDLAHSAVREASYAWIRLARRRHLHARFAATETLPLDVRAEHSLAAGAPEDALHLYLAAASMPDPYADGAHPQALLVAATRALDNADLGPRVSAMWLMRIATVATAVGLIDEAVDAMSESMRREREAGPAPEPMDLQPSGRRRRPDGDTASPPVTAEQVHGLKDRDVDVRARVLIDRCWPRRDLAAVRMLTAELDDIGVDDASPSTAAFAKLATIDGAVWAGAASAHLNSLQRLWPALREHPDPVVQARGALIVGWALHEVNHPQHTRMWVTTERFARAAGLDALWEALSAMIAADHGEMAEAREHGERSLASPASADWEPPLALMALARVHERAGRIADAVELLRRAVSAAQRSGQWLAVPELAARLAVLQTGIERSLAHVHLAVAESTVGEGQWFPRERTWILLARSLLTDPSAEEVAAGRADQAERSARSAELHWELRALRQARAMGV